MEMDIGVVGAAIRHIGGESEYGLKELKRLESEGRGTEFLGEGRVVLEAIRNTVMFDVSNEYHTLLGKLGLGPIHDPDAKGAPSVNAWLILQWLMQDLVKLNKLIRKVHDVCVAGSTSKADMDCGLFVMLLQAVGTQMLRSYGALGRELEKMCTDNSASIREGTGEDTRRIH